MACTIEPAALDRLQVAPAVRKDLGEFVNQLISFYANDLVSITVFGSAASGDYSEISSDVNLLVVYSDLNIADLDAVARLAQEWLRKRRFVPRFLSRRNLVDSARYFQIDYLLMREAHLVLCGEDILANLEMRRNDMHWQLCHEIKRMRMRVKQQFWRAAGDDRALAAILLDRFSSILHLSRAMLYLQGRTAPRSRLELEAALIELGADRDFLSHMLALKIGAAKPDHDELMRSFPRLMELIRLIDSNVDRLAM